MANNIALVDSFAEFKEFKNIDRPTMMRVLEDVFKTLLRKKYGSDENFDIIVNTDKGDLEIWQRREIVPDGEVEDPNTQIVLSEAISMEEDFEVGEETYEKIELMSFGRRAILAARQTLVSRILELEKDELYKNYKERIGEIINGEVYQTWKREMLVLDDDENELILPRYEQIRSDRFRKGDMVKAIVKKVELHNNTPRIILSRTDNSFLAKLLEMEVPEIFDEIITVQRIAREPGDRAKVAVESYDDRIDPVGACVGMKGSRVHGIVRELRNENIDIINFTQNTKLFIQRALTPAKINYIELDEENKRASVYLDPDQVSLAIGKGGVNIRLAGKLTRYEIDVFRDITEDEEYDIELEEFSDEIDMWVIKIFKNVGCDTAKSVLALSKSELLRRTDLEEETVEEVLDILRSEFDDTELEEEKTVKDSVEKDKAESTLTETAKGTSTKSVEGAPTDNVEDTSTESVKDTSTDSVEDTSTESVKDTSTDSVKDTSTENIVESEDKTVATDKEETTSTTIPETTTE